MIATKTEVTDLSEVTIRRISVSEMDNNVYLLTSKDEGTQVLIDAADDARAIAGLVGAGNGDCSQAYGNLQLIITTHSHWDHVRALEEVRSRSEAMTACGADDESDIAVPMDLTFEDGDTAASTWRSSACAGTPPVRSPWSTATRRARRTSSPATPSSPAVWAGRTAPRTSGS